MKTLKKPYHYVFYTGNASTPWSVGIAIRNEVLGNPTNIVKEVKINEATGKQIRAKYDELSATFKAECETLNQDPR